jgi:hypothetical protein
MKNKTITHHTNEIRQKKRTAGKAFSSCSSLRRQTLNETTTPRSNNMRKILILK